MGLIFIILSALYENSGRDYPEIFIIIAGGPLAWITMLIFKLIRGTRDFHKHKKYRALIKCPDGSIRWCYSSKLNDFFRQDNYDYVESSDIKEYIHFWDEDKYAVSRSWNGKDPNTRYAPPKVWKNFESVYKYIKGDK